MMMRNEGHRSLVVALPERVARRLAAAAPGAAATGAFVTDAVSRLQASLAVGEEIDVPRLGEGAEMLDIRVPWWVADQLDQAIGQRPGFVDRSTTLAAAISAHLEALAAMEPPGVVVALVAPPARPPRAESSKSVSQRAARPSASWVVRAERAVRRLDNLIGSRHGDRMEVEELFPPHSARPVELEAAEVVVGLVDDAVREVSFARARGAQEGVRVRLSGLTNRIAPTLWATAQLAVMQADVGGREVRYHDFLRRVMPRAWEIGEGLNAAYGSSSRRGFLPSARWPKVLERGTRDYADAEEARAGRRLGFAQAATGFIEYSLIGWPRSSRGDGRPVGPMAALGLASIWDESGGLWVAVNPAAVPLLLELGELGTSCKYPHSSDAWRAYEGFVKQHARCDEATDILIVLEMLASSQSRAAFYESASTFKMTERQLDRLRTRTSQNASTKGYSTAANGYIGRLREWGLVRMEEGVFGEKALTPSGREALVAFRNDPDSPSRETLT